MNKTKEGRSTPQETVTVHELKTDPQHFRDVVLGKKSCEIRNNDRQFKVGQILHLREFSRRIGAGVYTGADVFVRVDHVLDFPEGLRPGYVCLSITKM